MKKSILFMAGLIGLALTSCDDKSDLGIMQKNEAPVIVPADGVAIKSVYASTGNAVNLQNYLETVFIPVINVELSTVLPDDATVTGQVEIADNADFNNAVTVDLSSQTASSANPEVAAAVGGATRSLVGVVDVNAWEDAFTEFYGLNPAPQVNYLRYRLWLTEGSQANILYDKDGDEWYDVMEFTVTPFDAELDVASAYNLTYTVNGVETTVAMYHNPDKHVYDDPVFSAMVEVSEDDALAGFSWTVAPADDPARVFGVYEIEEPGDSEGKLEEIANGGEAGQISVDGSYKIEVNMLDKTFEVLVAPKSLYVMYSGAGQFTNVSQLATSDYITYDGMAGLLGVWCLTGQPSYKPTVYVNNPEVETTTLNGYLSGGLTYQTDGTPLNPNNGIPYPGGSFGLYYISANLQTLTYQGYACKTVGITGSMEDQNWGSGPDIALSSKRSDRYMIWTGTLTVAEGNEWKIRMNSDWEINFGSAGDGSYTTDGERVVLERNGGNFKATEDQTLEITVYFQRTLQEDGTMSPYYMTVTKK